MTGAVVPVPSPCISVCSMDEASGWCTGCLRTLDEIAAWSTLDDQAKSRVWARLPARRAALALSAAAAVGPAPHGTEAA